MLPRIVRRCHATVLRLLGIDHSTFIFQYQGLDQQPSGVEPARVIDGLMAFPLGDWIF